MCNYFAAFFSFHITMGKICLFILNFCHVNLGRNSYRFVKSKFDLWFGVAVEISKLDHTVYFCGRHSIQVKTSSLA